MTKVLLVEDDNNLREIYEARLAAEGYDISAAQDGEEALEAAKKVQPDLIISDVMMPRISGFEMLDILRNTQGLKHTKVIMLTALGQEEDKTRADSLGADRYLVKSQVTLEDIVKAADELLNGSEDATKDDSSVATPAPQPQQSDLSPTAPPAVAAAAHSSVPGVQSVTPQQPLSSFEDTNTQPTPAASSAGEPIVGGPAPVTTATVASDPLASNDQTLQAAAQALSAQPAMPAAAAPVVPPVAPVSIPTEPAAVPPVATTAPAAAPAVPAITPAVIDQTPAAPTPTVPTAPALDGQQPASQPVVTPPEAQAQPLPSLPEIERSMEETAANVAPQASATDAPSVVASTVPAPAVPTEPAAAPEVATATPAPVAEQPATDFARPTIGGTTPAAAPDVALPEAQTTAQESATVTDQINNFAPPQFPANVSEVVEAPGSPDAPAPVEPTTAPSPEVSAPAPVAEQPAAAPEMATSVQPVAVEQAPVDPMAAASAPSPSSLPATGGQRTIQPLKSSTPQVDINQLAAQEGSITSPAGTPDLVHQPGGVFTPDQSGSAADAAL